jgi:Ca-activated chloride channel family protein
MLDRDFILTLEQLAGDATLLCAPDTLDPDHHVVMASFCPVLPPRRDSSIAAAILVDCSGSMAGDSMSAAQSALHEVLGRMVAGDRFALSRFGSQVEHRSRGMWPFNGATLASARQWTNTLAADLGGTEMETALASTFALADGNAVDVLLITDGQISAIERTLDTARRSGHRVFVVGIGSSVAEAHLRRLAQDSGGACELLAPGEAAAPAIVRMFARIRAASASALRIRWPDDVEPVWSTALPANGFEGDTLHVFGLLRGRPAGSISLLGKVADSDGVLEIGRATMKDGVQDLPALPRMAAAARINGTSGSDQRYDVGAFAIGYQLVTPHTSFLLVHERAEQDKARDMPVLHKVAQMLPAGWGGVGSVYRMESASYDVSFSRREIAGSGSCMLRAPAVFRSRGASGTPRTDMAMNDIPAFLRMADVAHEPEPPARLAPFDACDPAHWNGAGDGEGFTPLGFAAWLAGQPASTWPRTYAELESAGMSKRVVEWLRRDIGMGRDEALIVMAFCSAMGGMGAADSRQHHGTATSERLHGALLDEAVQHIRDVIEFTGANQWPRACLQA